MITPSRYVLKRIDHLRMPLLGLMREHRDLSPPRFLHEASSTIGKMPLGTALELVRPQARHDPLFGNILVASTCSCLKNLCVLLQCGDFRPHFSTKKISTCIPHAYRGCFKFQTIT